jgi:hypothetical protein
MLFSGFYYLGSGDRSGGEGSQSELPGSVEQYKVEQLGNSSILLRVAELRNDLIGISGGCADIRDIHDLVNSSMPGVNSIGCEISNPSIDPTYGMVCGSYIMLKFNLKEIDKNSTEAIKRSLDGIFREYTLARGYMGNPLLNISGIDYIYVVGNLDTKQGDYSKVILFIKSGSTLGPGLIGFEREKIPHGTEFSALVVSISDIIVQANITGEFNPENISRRVNLTSVDFQSPGFRINGALSPGITGELNNLPEVKVMVEGNSTRVEFNRSMANILEILRGGNITHSLEKGTLMLRVPVNYSVGNLKEMLAENNIREAGFRKGGKISMPGEVIMENRLIRIPNHENLGATLSLDTEIGARINVTLSVLYFGEQAIPIQANEI